jgi:BASS family bile acid:Na+ symporter
MTSFHKAASGLALLCVGLLLLSAIIELPVPSGLLFVGFLVFFSVAMRAVPVLRGLSFTVLVVAGVVLALIYPDRIVAIGEFRTQGLITPLLQIIMFGMGTALSMSDFTRVFSMPKAVFIGMGCQLTIMPLVGLLVALLFQFPPEIAAGVILIGCVPGGLAPNVMAYLANGRLALSVTLTAVATILAPLTTPFLMRIYAGQFIEVDAVAMMISILKIVILPIALGLIVNRLIRGRAEWLHKFMPLLSMAGIVVILAIMTAVGRDNLLALGLALLAAGILHTGAGYLLGYWSCRALRLDEGECRTIAFEVGMQNAGLATGIAAELGKAATLGLAAVAFGPWMNISGSFLAVWWRNRPPQDGAGEPITDPRGAPAISG